MINLEPRGTAEAIGVRLDLFRQLNRTHLESRPDQLELEARIATFELAAKMHKYGFSLWMAGGGVKGGVTHGRTDDFGYHSIETS